MHFGYPTPFWRDAGLSGLGIEMLDGTSMLIADLSPPDGSTGILKTLGLAGMGGSPEDRRDAALKTLVRSEEHTSELQSLMRIPYAVFCLKKKKNISKLQTTMIPT